MTPEGIQESKNTVDNGDILKTFDGVRVVSFLKVTLPLTTKL